MIELQRNIVNFDFLDIVFTDIDSLLTLKIY